MDMENFLKNLLENTKSDAEEINSIYEAEKKNITFQKLGFLDGFACACSEISDIINDLLENENTSFSPERMAKILDRQGFIYKQVADKLRCDLYEQYRVDIKMGENITDI